MKYYRVTGNENKEIYEPETAKRTAEYHAEEFIKSKINQINTLSNRMQKTPILVCPFDAELFGHWWYDGPNWLESFLRKSSNEQANFDLIHLNEYLNRQPVLQVCNPQPNSWGRENYNNFWLNESNDWMYKFLHTSSKRLTSLANKTPNASGILKSALNQAARELLLAQSSDWSFILSANSCPEYAKKRFNDHIYRFNKICDDIINNDIDEHWLNYINSLDNIFPFIDYKLYANN